MSEEKKQPATPSAGAPKPSPFLVVGAGLALGAAVAKLLNWRGHAHPRG